MIETQCQQCGRRFTHRKEHPNKYCSRQCAGLSRRHKVRCKHCGRITKSSRNIFCSIKCMNLDKAARTIKTILCDECGVLFSKHQCHLTRNNFCSKECKGIWQSKNRSGANHPRSEPVWTEKVRIDSNGRQRAWVKIAYPNIWVQRSRYLLEQQGFVISEGRIVHHRDRDTLNDSLINLLIVTRKWHINRHRKELNAGKS